MQSIFQTIFSQNPKFGEYWVSSVEMPDGQSGLGKVKKERKPAFLSVRKNERGSEKIASESVVR